MQRNDHQVIQNVLGMQNCTGNNPLRILICYEPIQFALHSISVVSEDISSKVEY
jgi:hypothetical protein